ncbi:type II secretion system F family protein [Kordia jejudonensis]|uniref:type II secretion system F family protein n=1 Tax=Kordia jejudonensis TaxID=1348245 RepID=UPI0006296786|nr:type II secretion system F family protein [Kordia jejudonensis]
MSFDLKNSIQEKKRVTSEQSEWQSILKKEIVLFGNGFSNKLKEDFYTELSVLLSAGVSLKEGLELLCASQKKKTAKTILLKIVADLIDGKSLSNAIKFHNAFSEYEYYSIKIGEESGTLSAVVKQLGAFFGRKNQQRRDVISALTYPIIVFTTAFLVVLFMLQFVVPMFQDIFRQNKVDLPGITKFIIRVSEFIKSYGVVVVLGICMLFASRILFQKKEWYHRFKDALILKLPFFGNFIKTVYLSQFTQAIALLSASKVPVVNSIQLVKKMIKFHPLQDALHTVEEAILKGATLSESLASHSIFSDKMVALVKVSEQTNQTEFIFERLNTQYHEQVQRQSKMMSTIMEPIIIVFVGIMVGIILIAMYLPMFKLGTVLGG